MNNKFKPSPINLMNFGKYKGQTFEQIFAADPEYIVWLKENTDPADLKNDGKYAKQNQERLKYLADLIKSGVPEGTTQAVVTKPTGSDPRVLDGVIKMLTSIEKKLDILLGKTDNVEKEITEDDLKPDEDMPF